MQKPYIGKVFLVSPQILRQRWDELFQSEFQCGDAKVKPDGDSYCVVDRNLTELGKIKLTSHQLVATWGGQKFVVAIEFRDRGAEYSGEATELALVPEFSFSKDHPLVRFLTATFAALS